MGAAPPSVGSMALSDLTVVAGPSSPPLTARISGGRLLLDHVQLTGSTPSLSSYFTDLGGGSLLATNSSLGYLAVNQSLPYHNPGSSSQIIASEIDSSPVIPGPASVICLASYNSANQPLTTACTAPTN